MIASVMILLGHAALYAQNIRIQPYLQHATPTSIVIMWETDVESIGKVTYGLTPALGIGVLATSITTPGGFPLYTASLTGLTAGTRYYYKVVTGSWQSATYDFVTPPLPSSEAGFNIVLMSDMQKDGGNPNIFSNLINTSLLPYIDSAYGSPLSDHLQMAILPGDVVANGNTYAQWKTDFFNPGEALWKSVPNYPAIGNHELNSVNYFNYFNLPANGTPGYLEHWYSHDYSNVRVLSFDTNVPYRVAAQLAWLDSMLAITCTDPDIDFVFAQMHHPYKSELWTPGETDYTGEIIERLEAFSDTCDKPTVHFFGHTHAYSRGESRDHNHLWVNVATSGGNIDYWGEFSNQDYDEFIVSQDEYGFVMVEVTAGANPQFVLKRLSFGDQYNPGGATQSDHVVIRKNNNPPKQPVALFPKSSDIISPLCLELEADGFSDPDGDPHGASHWQISTDSANFSTLVHESWKQYANWYYDTNLQAFDTLTDEAITNLQGGTDYWWRVRYRDTGLKWSAWSVPTKFSTESIVEITGNLIVNPGGETGTNGWTPTIGVIESLDPLECNGITPFDGSKYFAVGALCVEHPFASAYQDLDVASYANGIDSGFVLVQYGAYLSDYAGQDEPSLALQFLNSTSGVIASSDTLRHRQDVWTLRQNSMSIPPGTRTIRFILMGTRYSGTDNDSYFDNIFCKLIAVFAACNSYEPPGPAFNRIYVDRNAPGTPDGENWTTAYHSLGTALLQAHTDTTIREVWIADGFYPVTTNAARDTSFRINRGLAIYGGFSGNENDISQRNITANLVHLTGETGDTSDLTDNCYHVVRVENVTDTVVLDGLVICCGYADQAGDDSGGGLYISVSNIAPVILSQCRVENNYAVFGSSLFNAAETYLEDSWIVNEVTGSASGYSIINDGIQARLTARNTFIIQTCTECPDVIRNLNGAQFNIRESVSIEIE